jgi:hypothetical protein
MVTRLKARLVDRWKAERAAAGIFPPYVNPFVVTVTPKPVPSDPAPLLEANAERAAGRRWPPKPRLASAASMKANGWHMDYRRDKTGRLR